MRNEIKRDLGISDRFIDRIDYLTHFDFKSFRLQNRKKVRWIFLVKIRNF